MIHDKDYIIRIVKQFSEMIANMLLGKNEGTPEEEQMVFETQMKDIFKMSFEELSAKSIAEINDFVTSKDEPHHIAYYELLGNLFFYKFKENPNRDLAEKANEFYNKWLQKSGTFSIPVMGRLGELKKYLE